MPRLPFALSPSSIVLSLGLLGGLAVGCHRTEEGSASASTPPHEAATLIHVQTAAVAELPVPEYITLTGSLRADQESNIAADANGKVLQVLVERGQEVKGGQVVATLDARAASLSASAAQAQARLAQSQLEQARRECDRVKKLLETGAISQAEFDQQTSQCTVQQWSSAAAEAQQASATKLLGDTHIRAPFDGIIGERLVNVGQYVEPSTRVASIYDPDPLRLAVTVPEASLAAIHEGMPVAFTVAAFPNDSFTGSVKFISPNVRETSRDLVVEAIVPNKDGRLRPGMFAVARIQTGERPYPVVPTAALARDETETRVFVVGPGHEVQEHLVQLGESKDGFVAVLNGVKTGDSVVLQPGPDVHDGARVQ
jgi:RND family efflux transporter MFP subunit